MMAFLAYLAVVYVPFALFSGLGIFVIVLALRRFSGQRWSEALRSAAQQAGIFAVIVLFALFALGGAGMMSGV
ncbi:hypothetical protein [Nereida sp. MMG025]|uniref:hypothetical protein n=1 Tax=Nereida sp. MMG025 TaxID=2909981 RepID=UPI001F40DB54|nr:hypothetical protein [Nereida sp. MMG025]MCF6445512.1 hypothetical protein [Nereida sp. MMG025]